MNSAVYIDDTGTPQESESKYDCGNWKSYVAVILKSGERNEINESIEKLKEKYGIKEFHFTNIFSGKEQFKELSPGQRINLFNEFKGIYLKFKCPIIIQSLTDDDVIRNQMTWVRNKKHEGFNFSKNDHVCLWLLLARVAQFKWGEGYSLPVEIYVDAGKQSPDTYQELSILKSIAKGSHIVYKDSSKDNLIQFADFIAYVLNRCRWILMNNLNSEKDYFMLEFASGCDFNTLNMTKKPIPEEDYRKGSMSKTYDKFLRQAYDKNGNLSDEEVDRIKKVN